MSITIADVEAARRTIAGQVLRTPMLPAPKLSVLTGAEVYVKYENLQVTNSFKDRGALNKLASLSESARARGVIAMSAGNHAQAVAYHAARLAIPATVVMPVTTPFVKVEATQAHGAEVMLQGETVAEAQIRAEILARERGLTFVHPYDDPLVIAGQGTIALEMLEDAPDLDVLVIPIGGGGLAAGQARHRAGMQGGHQRGAVAAAADRQHFQIGSAPAQLADQVGGGLIGQIQRDGRYPRRWREGRQRLLRRTAHGDVGPITGCYRFGERVALSFWTTDDERSGLPPGSSGAHPVITVRSCSGG